MNVVTFNQLADLLPEAAFLVRADGGLVAMNRAAARLTARAPGAVEDLSLSDLVLDPADRLARYLTLCARSRSSIPGALTFRTPAGDTCECRIDGAVFERAAPPRPAVVLLRCRPKHELSRHFRILNETIASLSREILERLRAEESLRASEERLRHADRMEAVGRLAGGVAHETNNQMSVVLGAAHFILRRADLAPEVRADVEHIRRAAERTAGITRQLLAFSRRQVLRPEPLDLNAVVRNLQPILQRILGENVRLIVLASTTPATIRADRGQLEQVLINLALNARDAMPMGGTLTISTDRVLLSRAARVPATGEELPPGTYVVLHVTDTGRGMDRDILRRVFEPFFTTKEVGQGTGLGLSTAYGIIRQSGGMISADSEPGRGTTFTIYLPAIEEETPAHTMAPEPRVPSESTTVLVVEDDPSVRNVLVRTLAEHGYQVMEAEHGEAALGRLAACRGAVHLVIADLLMPRIDGRELAEELAARHPGLPVLLVAGHPKDDPVLERLAASGLAVLSKPIAPEVLLQTVAEILQTRRATAASHPDTAPLGTRPAVPDASH